MLSGGQQQYGVQNTFMRDNAPIQRPEKSWSLLGLLMSISLVFIGLILLFSFPEKGDALIAGIVLMAGGAILTMFLCFHRHLTGGGFMGGMRRNTMNGPRTMPNMMPNTYLTSGFTPTLPKAQTRDVAPRYMISPRYMVSPGRMQALGSPQLQMTDPNQAVGWGGYVDASPTNAGMTYSPTYGYPTMVQLSPAPGQPQQQLGP